MIVRVHKWQPCSGSRQHLIDRMLALRGLLGEVHLEPFILENEAEASFYFVERWRSADDLATFLSSGQSDLFDGISGLVTQVTEPKISTFVS